MRILNLNNVADEALFKGYYNVVCSSILPFGQGENIFSLMMILFTIIFLLLFLFDIFLKIKGGLLEKSGNVLPVC